MKTIYIILLIWNIIVMFVYATDKLLARKKKRRIKETTLIIPAFLFGGAGAILGMVIFNHKTSKIKFRILVPLATVLSATAVIWLSYLRG